MKMFTSDNASSDHSGSLELYLALLLIASGHAVSVILDFTIGTVVLGVITVGYIPGTLLIRLLFRRSKQLAALEHSVLSVVFSLLLCASLGLLLNLLPQGLSPTNINLALWASVGLLLALDLGFRTGRAGEDAQANPRSRPIAEELKARLSTAEIVAYSGITVIALICLALLAVLLLRAESGELYTEFYILGPDGTAEAYPAEVAPGQPIDLIIGVTNHEHANVQYRIERVDPFSTGQVATMNLAHEETWEQPYTFTLTQPGPDQKVEFLLYKEDDSAPHRSLHLWLTVTAD